jgi:2-keto-3-deoxy-galactonokinase
MLLGPRTAPAYSSSGTYNCIAEDVGATARTLWTPRVAANATRQQAEVGVTAVTNTGPDAVVLAALAATTMLSLVAISVCGRRSNDRLCLSGYG